MALFQSVCLPETKATHTTRMAAALKLGIPPIKKVQFGGMFQRNPEALMCAPNFNP